MAKDGIEHSGLRGKREVIPVSLNPYAIVNNEK
jgi:hypothetical protein